jgi:hypothetical protein
LASERSASTQGNSNLLVTVNGEDVMKKMQMFDWIREVHGWRVDLSDDIRPDRLTEIRIDAILGRQIEMRRHPTASKLTLSVGAFPQRMIHHLHHDLEVKCDHLAGVSKS